MHPRTGLTERKPIDDSRGCECMGLLVRLRWQGFGGIRGGGIRNTSACCAWYVEGLREIYRPKPNEPAAPLIGIIRMHALQLVGPLAPVALGPRWATSGPAAVHRKTDHALESALKVAKPIMHSNPLSRSQHLVFEQRCAAISARATRAVTIVFCGNISGNQAHRT